jgi:hypothetical protein
MVVPFGSARERRSRTTYRPTMTPEGSTHVDTFTGTTSSFSGTASGKVAVVAVVHQQVFAEAPGPAAILNPFLLDRSRRGKRANVHHNPMEPYRNERTGLYRPRVPTRIPRSIPDEEFNEIFARLSSHRDRALVAF